MALKALKAPEYCVVSLTFKTLSTLSQGVAAQGFIGMLDRPEWDTREDCPF